MEDIARVIPEVGICLCNDRVSQRFGKVLRVCVAQWDVTAWQSRAGGGRKGENDMLRGAVVDPGGLEEKSIRRVEERWKDLDGREVSRQVDVGECRCNDERSDQQGKNHPCAEENIASSGFASTLPGKP